MLNNRRIHHMGEKITLPLYLDYPASTPLDDQVREAMAPYLAAAGNPHSQTHGFGHELSQAIEIARTQVAALISAKPHEIVFTSGATEANNLALLGLTKARGMRGHIISAATEHEAVLQPLKALEADGIDVTLLPVDESGQINLDELKSAFRPETFLVTLMAANNETGVCHDLNAIGPLCSQQGVAFHSDATQALTTEIIDVTKSHLSLLSLSGHKLYGPTGIGALFVREGTQLEPLFFGGTQEQRLRPGSLPTALCVGLGAATAITNNRRAADKKYLSVLRDKLKASLKKNLAGQVRFNGEDAPNAPGCLSVTLVRIDAEDLLFELPDLALSTGSACTSGSSMASHVLTAMGHSANEANSTFRIGFGRKNTLAEIDLAAGQIANAYDTLTGRAGSKLRKR